MKRQIKIEIKEIIVHVVIGVIAATVAYFIPVPNLRYTLPAIAMSIMAFILYMFYAIYFTIKNSKN